MSLIQADENIASPLPLPEIPQCNKKSRLYSLTREGIVLPDGRVVPIEHANRALLLEYCLDQDDTFLNDDAFMKQYGRFQTEEELRTIIRQWQVKELDGQELTTREREVAVLTAEGLRASQVAERLGISEKTVKAFKTRCFRKTGTQNATTLARWVIRQGWIVP